MQFSQLLYFYVEMIRNDVFCCNCIGKKYGDVHMGIFLCTLLVSAEKSIYGHFVNAVDALGENQLCFPTVEVQYQ